MGRANSKIDMALELERMAAVDGRELPPDVSAYLTAARKQGVVKGGGGAGTPLPAWAATPYEKQVSAYGGLAGSASTFNDDFGGNLAGKVENKVQSIAGGIGTPGQRDWWANFRTNDNQIRNDLFGATLTPGETAAYTATTISEEMDPAEIRTNLQRRRDIVAKALGRKTKFLRAQGYSSEAIDALAGEYLPDFGDAPTPDVDPDKTVLNPAEAAGAAVTGAIDKAAGIEPPPPPTGSVNPATGALRVNINGPSAKPAVPEGRGDPGFVQSMDAAIRGAADTATLGFADEISAAGKTIFDGGTMADNLKAERATDRYDEANNTGARIAGQVLGGFALPMGAARSAAALGGRGAAYGAGYGFGSGDTAGERAGGAVAGAALGGATGAGLGALGARLNRASPRSGGNVEGRATLEAGQRLGIDTLPADVGGAFVRGATATAAQLPGAASSVRAGAQRVNQQALGARDRIGAGVGTAAEPEAAGEAARTGAQAFITRTGGVGNGAYARAEALANGAMVSPTNARAALTRNIAELQQVPGGAEGLAALTTLRDELAGDFTVAGVRGMRTALRDRFISQNLRGSDLERRVNQVIDAAGEDVVASLTAQGNTTAARAYGVADRYWRNRLRVIDETLAPIIGKEGEKSGEAVVQALNTAAKGNSARLASFVRSLPPEESATVRATMISQLGRASAGTQDAAGTAFSLPQFLTHWNQMQPGAKRALFDGQTRAALDDLATVANGTKQAQRFANTSNTGGVVGGIATGATAALDLATLGKTLALQYGAGRLLASPGFARWLARAPNANPGSHINALGAIVTRNPGIAQELTGLQQRLVEATTRGPSRLVAGEEPDNRRQIPPQE